MIEKATGVSPRKVLGKPDPAMIEGILERYGLRPSQVVMVGDRLYTDILMSHRAGVLGVLVLTGESTWDDANLCQNPPDLVLPSVAELGALLERSRRGSTLDHQQRARDA